MKTKLFLLFIIACNLSMAQKSITWDDLADVTFTDKYFPIYEEYFMYPNFGENVKSLDGQLVELQGYFLNISPEDNLYILSKSTMAMCFFCGMGGPETVVELRLDDNPKLKTDTVVKITATLQLNSEDVDHLIYILKDCKLEKVN
ncbi:hypothetical protein [Winogradskyella endarachnes]|uniref:DUF3299 domain-containing protein n=1 Tax=Winogradskyella endarachnes TaxID=2681965 RepID=A0A6L6U8A5_9FLAO|nr:hypothetical protein [Winogradskyella endarachnes]MUU77112.1 hypothetical protein [Winogradskyella endarachnes]